MALTVEWTRYGRAAADALAAQIAAAKAGDELAPVTVVVPSNTVGVASRRELAVRLGGFAGVAFLTVYRLAELLGARALAASGRRPVSTPVLAAAVRAVLADDGGVFAAVATHAATESALVSAYRELRDVPESGLAALEGRGPKAAEVVRVHRAVRARLAGSWYDEQDLLGSALAWVTGSGGGADVAALGRVVVHLPQSLSPAGAAFLAALADRTDVLVIAGATGDATADAEVAAAIVRLGGTTPPPDEHPFEGVVAADRTAVLTTSDAEDEVRHAVRRVVAVASEGVPFHRIAVLHASPEPYGRLLHEHLGAAGVPTNGAAVVPLSQRIAARALLHLLALPEGGFRREELFAWLTAVPVLVRGRPAPVSAWERISRDAGVVRGRADWDERLATFAADRRADADEDEDDEDAPDWWADRAREEAARADDLRRFVCGLVDDLAERVDGDRPWGDHAAWAHDQLDGILGSGDRREADRWPSVELRAAEKVERALERIAALEAVEGPVSLAVFTRTLELELERDLGRVGRLGEGVLVGSVGMGLGLDLDLVVVLGLSEGTFPRPVRDDSLLPDDDRAVCDGTLSLRRDRIGREHRQLVASLAAARSQVLGVPRGDLRRSSHRVPSRWVVAVVEHLHGAPLPAAGLESLVAPWVEHVPSFDAGLRRLGSPATATEHRLRTLLAGAALDDDAFASAAEVVEQRNSPAFTRFDGNLEGMSVPSPAGAPMSPTRLEAWAVCPSAYLLGTVLGAKPVENPEEELELTALDRGNLVHAVLERFAREALARPGGPPEVWTDGDHELLQQIASEEFASYRDRGLTGLPIFWRRDERQLRAQLARWLELDDAHRAATGARLLDVEIAFGFDDDGVAIALDGGGEVRFRGRADRLDVDASGRAIVTDYKTGRRPAGIGQLAVDPVLAGTKLQLPVYGLAARLHPGVADGAPVHAEYWFCSDKGDWKREGYDLTDDVLSRTRATLTRIVRGIEAGIFPPHPSASTTNPWVSCHHCDPDGLGEAELRRAWDRKRKDPRLAAYADLVEPLDENGAADA